jgi:dolichol-phosphate mannosyltransferase
MTSRPPRLSIVIPVLNEQETIPLLIERLDRTLEKLPASCEIIFADDGSTDDSVRLLKAAYDRARPANVSVRIVSLSRNFGHQPAITAGLNAATGDAVVVMDADLQDPPELIGPMFEKWTGGHLVVLPYRVRRKERLWKRLQFHAFYKALGLLSDFPIILNVGVFGLMDRRVLVEVLKLPERNRFLPGLRSWVGFDPILIPYEREDRVAGAPKQTLAKLYRYAMDSIFAFSYKPLRFSWMLGSTVSVVCFLYAVVLTALRLLEVNVVRGFTTPTVAILFLGGVQLIMIGILGEYLARIYDEVKGRPHYIVRDMWESPKSQDRSGDTGPAD